MSTDWKPPPGAWSCPAGRQVLSVDADRDVWLAERRSMLCASDIAAVVGVTPPSWRRDAFTVWADKTGRTPDDDATDAMARGSIFESAVIELWASRYIAWPIATRRMGLMRSLRNPRAGATVDRLSVCEAGRCLIEAKTSIDLSEWGTDEEPEVPVHVQFQGQWQLYVTGRDHVHFVALGPRFVPIHRLMHRDDELIEAAWQHALRFWFDHVETDEPPQPTAQALDVIRRLYANPVAGAKHVIGDDLAEIVRAAGKAKGEADDAEARYKDLLAQVQVAVGDATVVEWSDGDTAATWNPTAAIDGANAAWRKAHPDLVAAFSRPKPDLDVKAMVAAHPELLTGGGLRHRRSWLWKS